MRATPLVSARLVIQLTGAAIAAFTLLTLTGCQKMVAQAAPPPPTVGVAESKRMNIPVMVSPNGTTRAMEMVTIRARVRGFLTERHFAEGAMVKKGQLLLVIDEEPYQVALQSGPKARQAEADASLKKAEESKGPRGLRADAARTRPRPSSCSPRSRRSGTGRS